jgi:hypothetical protein
MIFFKIDLEEIREILNIKYKEKGTQPCILCGKEIKNYNIEKTKMVQLTTDGCLVPVDIDVEDSQGLFPVGSDCAKRLRNLISITS